MGSGRAACTKFSEYYRALEGPPTPEAIDRVVAIQTEGVTAARKAREHDERYAELERAYREWVDGTDDGNSVVAECKRLSSDRRTVNRSHTEAR